MDILTTALTNFEEALENLSTAGHSDIAETLRVTLKQELAALPFGKRVRAEWAVHFMHAPREYESTRIEFNWVAWERWNEYMISTGSKSHAENPDSPGRTLCGVTIPESGNGVEVGSGGDYGDGTCKRCENAVHTWI